MPPNSARPTVVQFRVRKLESNYADVNAVDKLIGCQREKKCNRRETCGHRRAVC